MSENSKCPCCGDAISDFPDSGFYECDSCPFMCALADLPRIASAMDAEARHNALVEAVKSVLEWEYMNLVTEDHIDGDSLCRSLDALAKLVGEE